MDLQRFRTGLTYDEYKAQMTSSVRHRSPRSGSRVARRSTRPTRPLARPTFRVRVGDDLVHSMARDGGFPELAAVVGAVREALGG